ncbi:hypothetical protein CNR22_20645 [Sphingobacteriaceae bacterium]|nr:hypothetical protein CNR22_20645 [Sphingobacteriaceae bacterium]
MPVVFIRTQFMKSKISILLVFYSLSISAQIFPATHTSVHENLLSLDYSSGLFFERGEYSYLSDLERLNLSTYNSFAQPAAPILTSHASDLEICTGHSTRLTATSGHSIYWYTVPPPLGTPVATGPIFITPILSTGYYTYYAVAENNGVRSEITSMEVVMVYPSPSLTVTSNATSVCANETATLTVSGTTYYEWEFGPIASQMTITPIETQTYKVTGINTAGCKSTVEFTQHVDLCYTEYLANSVSKKSNSFPLEETGESIFSVFPNPNNGAFTIHLGDVTQNTRVEIYNALGQLIYSSKISEELTAIAIDDVPNGIYVIRILEKDKVQRQQKILKG